MGHFWLHGARFAKLTGFAGVAADIPEKVATGVDWFS
jgi:hypothetical protein